MNKEYELTEEQHEVMKLLCEGNDAEEIARAIKATVNTNINANRVSRMLSYDPNRTESIYYRLSMRHYGGRKEVRDQAHAVYLYTLHYICSNVEKPVTNTEAETEKGSLHSIDGLTRAQRLLWWYSTAIVVTLLTTLYICSILFLFVPAWEVGCTNCFVSYYTNSYFLIPMIGGICGLIRLKTSDISIRNSYLRASIWFCVGMIAWGIGNALWLRYNLIGWDAPYPYWPDAAFIIHSFTWFIGMAIIYNNTSTLPKTYLFIVIAIVVLSGSLLLYIMLAERNWKFIPNDDPWKLFFDIGYPLFEIVNVSLLVLASFTSRRLDNEQPRANLQTIAYILALGMLMDFSADFIFSIDTTRNMYVNGRLPDFLFATAFFVLGIGIQFIPLTQNGSQIVEQDKNTELIT